MLRVEFLDRQNSYSEVYLDEAQSVFKQTLRQGEIFVLERSSPEELRGLFPDKSDEIMQPEE